MFDDDHNEQRHNPAQEELNREFLEACRAGSLASAQAAVANGANAEEARGHDEETGLHWACAAIPYSGELFRYLVDELHLDVDATAKQGMTCAHWAVKTNNTSALEDLHSRGANLAAPGGRANITPETLADHMCHKEAQETIRGLTPELTRASGRRSHLHLVRNEEPSTTPAR